MHFAQILLIVVLQKEIIDHFIKSNEYVNNVCSHIIPPQFLPKKGSIPLVSALSVVNVHFLCSQ